jgi:HEAT repeat protein
MGIGAPVTPLTAARNENRYTRCEPTLRLKHAAANYVTRPAASKSDRLRRHSGRLAHTTALSSEAMSEARITRERGDFDRLLQLLAHGDRTTRLGAARQLGKLGDQRAVPPLVGCLQASDFLLRTAAAKALGEIGNPSAVEALYSTAVEDENHYVRGQAAAELFRLGDERGFVLLSKLLHEPRNPVSSALAQVDGSSCSGVPSTRGHSTLAVGQGREQSLGTLAARAGHPAPGKT